MIPTSFTTGSTRRRSPPLRPFCSSGGAREHGGVRGVPLPSAAANGSGRTAAGSRALLMAAGTAAAAPWPPHLHIPLLLVAGGALPARVHHRPPLKRTARSVQARSNHPTSSCSRLAITSLPPFERGAGAGASPVNAATASQCRAHCRWMLEGGRRHCPPCWAHLPCQLPKHAIGHCTAQLYLIAVAATRPCCPAVASWPSQPPTSSTSGARCSRLLHRAEHRP